ncbi:MAG: hypothetical protein U0263_17320 [Polyangiaceae bacterium]
MNLRRASFFCIWLGLSLSACSVGPAGTRADGPKYAAGPGYQPGPGYSPNGAPPTPGGRHFFEGYIDYRGFHGKAPGKPFEMKCAMRHEDLRCNVSSSDAKLPAEIGFRGPGNTLCIRPGKSPAWIPMSLATVGFLFSLLPDDIRQKAVHETQSQYRWTGRTFAVLGRTCRKLEDRSDEGSVSPATHPTSSSKVTKSSYHSLHQMGPDPGFGSSLTKAASATSAPPNGTKTALRPPPPKRSASSRAGCRMKCFEVCATCLEPGTLELEVNGA